MGKEVALTEISKSIEKNFSIYNEIKISILVPVKNEESNLTRLFESLNNIDYPPNCYELIFIDDNSVDNSSDLIKNFIDGKYNFRLINARTKPIKGKKGVLEVGIKESKYSHILQTDADCIVPSFWLKTYSKYFADGYDLIFGPAPVMQTSGFLNSFICFENLRTQILVNTFAKFGFPYSGAARNMGYRKDAIEKIGGFSKFNVTLSGDDDLFIREASKINLKIKFIEEVSASVQTSAAESFKDFLNQKARHVSTSHNYHLIHKMLLAKWHLLNIMFVSSVFLTPISMLFLIPFLAKMIFDIIYIQKFEGKYAYKFKIYLIPIYQIIYEGLLIVNFLRSFGFKNRWK